MMKFELGKTGIHLPAIGLGTWGMGGKFSADLSDDEKHVRAILKAVELGMTHIDTAEFYAQGHTEEIVGKALSRLKREDVFITSKIWPTHLNYKDALNSVKSTLKRLGTDHLDLYLIHWPSYEVSLEDSIDVMNAILDKGFTKYIGVSNFSVSDLDRVLNHSKAPIVCNQVKYNIEDRSALKSGLLDYCKSKGVSVVAYSPLNRMSFSSKTKIALQRVSKARDLTLVQVALAWLNTQGIFSIPKSSQEAHLLELSKAGDIILSEDEMKILSGR